jgi:tRNA pseudouridine55 synthase
MWHMDGLLLIDKPAGLTSHDVVNQVRRIIRVRRVGHTGTLDPFATGLLAVLVGRATRLARFLSGLEKEYEAVIRLGYATDTGDINGKPLPSAIGTSTLSKEQIEAALNALRGDIDQVPPMYSAKKQAGRKLYELARRGEEVERKPVRVRISSFEPIKPSGELLKDNLDGTFDFEVRVECSSGTYIRTLAEDFGKQLGVGAHLAELRRTRIGDFKIAEAATLEQVKVSLAEESLGTLLRKPDEALPRFPFVDLSPDKIRRVQQGLDVEVEAADWSDGEPVRMRDAAGDLVAVGIFDTGKKKLHPILVVPVEN